MLNDGLRYSAKTHVGRVREVNEDSILALPEAGIWLVADGMGGHDAGDFASQMIVDTVSMIPDGLGAAERMRWVRSAIHKAHKHIRHEANDRGSATIGATVVALIFAPQSFVAFWAGDSRLYRLRNGELDLISMDHSAVAPLVESGQLTWDEAERLPEANVITRAVGVGDELELSKIRGDVIQGDRFLICSDGLSRYYGLADLQRILVSQPIETVVEVLLEGALEAGGADNISVIVVDAA